MPDQDSNDKPAEQRPQPVGNAQARPEMSPRVRVYGMIGQRLREFYDGVASEPVPDRFTKLLQQLEQRGKADQGSKE
jgi:hypothetical protein